MLGIKYWVVLLGEIILSATKTTVLAFPVLYTAAFYQGMVQVCFMALSGFFTNTMGITEAQYGSIFLPQLVGAIVGGLLAAFITNRIGLVKTLGVSITCNTLSQILIVASILFPQYTFVLLCVATFTVGVGFGTSSGPLNLMPGELFPKQKSFALLSLHTLIGVGLALGPYLSGYFAQFRSGLILPSILAGTGIVILLIAFALIILDAKAPITYEAEDVSFKEIRELSFSLTFWRFWLLVLIYALMESTLTNWAVIYLNQYKLYPQEIAQYGLTGFWAGLAIGRLAVAGLSLVINSRVLFQLLPILPALGLFLMPYIQSEWMGIGLFALAGFGCSALFPLCINLAADKFPKQATHIAPLFIATLMVGVGLGSFGVGYLRQFLTFEAIYQFSIIYPLLMFGLILWELSCYKKDSLASN